MEDELYVLLELLEQIEGARVSNQCAFTASRQSQQLDNSTCIFCRRLDSACNHDVLRD